MSTVAYRNGIMAADSAGWSGDTYMGTHAKMRQVGTRLVGCVGGLASIELFMEYMKKRTAAALQKLKELEHKTDQDSNQTTTTSDLDLAAICVDSDGSVSIWDNSLVPITVEADYYATGSGEEYALGAMAMGAAAEQAVRAAAHHDAHTRLPVVVMKLGGE
jgi:ATP-dependent protease HslVU (ClpYQ) peptidase subunit